MKFGIKHGMYKTDYIFNYVFRTSSIIFLIILICFFWYLLGPKKAPLSYERENIANVAINKALTELRINRGDIKSIAVLHFKNDPTDYITYTLRKRLLSSGILNVEQANFSERLRDFMSLTNEGTFSMDEAIKYGKRNNLDGVIIGTIDRFEAVEHQAIIKGRMELIDIRNEKSINSITFDEDTSRKISNKIFKALDIPQDNIIKKSNFPWYIRLLAFITMVLLLPIFSIAFIRFMVRKRSNRINGVVLSLYTLIATLFALLALNGDISSKGNIVILLIAIIFAFIYNISIMTLALKLEE